MHQVFKGATNFRKITRFKLNLLGHFLLQLFNDTFYIPATNIESNKNAALGIVALNLIGTIFEANIGKFGERNFRSGSITDIQLFDVLKSTSIGFV